MGGREWNKTRDRELEKKCWRQEEGNKGFVKGDEEGSATLY